MAELRDNPIQTDGFEFVEYAVPDPRALGELFERLGFQAVARHRHKDVLLYKQGDVNFIVNAEPRSFAQNFARRHGPSVCAMAFRVKDAAAAYDRLLERGAWGVESRPGPGELSIPARSEEHTSELQSQSNLVCRLLLEKKKGALTHVASYNKHARHTAGSLWRAL